MRAPSTVSQTFLMKRISGSSKERRDTSPHRRETQQNQKAHHACIHDLTMTRPVEPLQSPLFDGEMDTSSSHTRPLQLHSKGILTMEHFQSKQKALQLQRTRTLPAVADKRTPVTDSKL